MYLFEDHFNIGILKWS